jgi:choline dehydrogenase
MRSGRSADRADVVVIGGGSAGSVVAARLTEDLTRRVVLVEEGADPQPIPEIIADPKRQADLIRDPAYVRLYPTQRLDGSSFELISGKVLGGGSSVNKLGVMRPLRRDFDHWATLGGVAWSYDALLPVIRAIEDDRDFPDSPIHGNRGPLKVQRAWTFDGPCAPPLQAIIAAADDLGIPRCVDDAAPDAYGLCGSPYNVVGGRRHSAVNAFLDAARDRPNLIIRSMTKATRLLLSGGKVQGVEIHGPGGSATIEADQVVVSAGSYQTPHLLLLSGIGPPAKIESVGLSVRHRLDGVGENFQDHAVVYLTYRGTDQLRADDAIPSPRLWVASRPGLGYGDLHIVFHPAVPSPGARLLPVSVRLMEQRERGQIRLASADPADLPAVDSAILRAPDDLGAILNGIRQARGFCRHPRMAEFYEDPPDTRSDTDQAWGNHALSTVITYNHATGTCRFGDPSDPLAVVGPDLRVHGFDNLWLADMSVIPVIPHAPTNLTAYLVGSIAARNIVAAGV